MAYKIIYYANISGGLDPKLQILSHGRRRSLAKGTGLDPKSRVAHILAKDA